MEYTNNDSKTQIEMEMKRTTIVHFTIYEISPRRSWPDPIFTFNRLLWS